MQAYRIVDWQKTYELTTTGKPAKEDTPMESLRKSPFPYVRISGEGHMLGPAKRRMFKKAWAYGDNMDVKCWGLYTSLLDLARDQVREYRGWILDDRQRPINPVQIADVLGIQDANIIQMFEILTCEEVRWVELVEFPDILQNNGLKTRDVNLEELTGDSVNLPGQGKKGGEKVNSPNAFLNRNETGNKGKDKPEPKPKGNIGDSVNLPGQGKFTRAEEKHGEESGSGNAGRPHSPPPPESSISVSIPDSIPDSVSEKPPISDSFSSTFSDSDSFSGAGAANGAAYPGSLSEQGKFEIARACKKAALELSQIIRPRNSSDITTINDIFSQLQQRLISGCREPLFEMAVNSAKQCLWADNPIAMFVAAMKKPPFFYVPKS